MKNRLPFLIFMLLTTIGCQRKTRVETLEATRALYDKAVEESRQGKREEAYSDFLQALRDIDGLAGKRKAFHFKRNNPDYEHFTALVYGRLAWFFYTYDEWEEALECLKLSNECFENENNREGIAANYALMGDVMLAQGDRKVSLDYYKKSDSIYEALEVNNDFHHDNRLFHKALMLFDENQKEECHRVLNSALQGTDSVSRLAKQIHFMLGYWFLENQEQDSALYHFECSYPLLPRQTMKTYCNSIQLANALGDSIKAAQYGQLLADFTFQQFYQKSEKLKMVAMFEEYKDEKDKAKNRSLFLYILGFVVLMAATITGESFLIHYRQRRSKVDQIKHERIKISLERQIAQTNAEAKLKEERISTLQHELEKAIANPDFQRLPFDEKMEVLKQIPVSKRALKVLDYNVKAGLSYPELVMSDNQLGQLIHSVDAVFPKFSVKMIEQYPRLKRSDVMYCCLYILGLNEIQAAALTGKTYQAVWKRSAKLHEVLDNKSDLRFVLYEILKSW